MMFFIPNPGCPVEPCRSRDPKRLRHTPRNEARIPIRTFKHRKALGQASSKKVAFALHDVFIKPKVHH
jgi:hypothetical protein